MDLTSPLRSLIPSLDSAVLEVLAGTQSGLSASQIARLAPRGSRQGLSLALDRLSEHGLVIAEPANQGFLYRLNRDHVLTGALLLALDARLVLIKQVKGAVERLEPEPVHVALFGSFARADGTPGSDIDLFVLAGPHHDLHDASWQAQIHELADRVLAWSGNRLETLMLTADTFAQAVRTQEPLVGFLLDQSIRLRGDPLVRIIEELTGPLSGQRG